MKNFRLFNWLIDRKRRPSRLRRARRVQLEGLENRRLLVADIDIVGDSDFNGQFDSTDIVQVFQAGKFETGQEASYSEGDWNGDGVFNSTDIVFAFQAGMYGISNPLAAESADTLPEVMEPDVGDGTGDDDDPECRKKGEGKGSMLRRAMQRGRGEPGKGLRVQPIVNKLNEGIESGDLPGDLTAEEAQQMIDSLTSAAEAGDREAVKAVLKQLRVEKQEDHIQSVIDRLSGSIESGELPGNMTSESAQALVDGLSQALADGNLESAHDLIKQMRKDLREDQREERREELIQSRIDRLQAALDSGELPPGMSADDATALIAAYTSALETGDLKPVRELRMQMDLQRRIDHLQSKIDAGELPEGVNVEELQASLDAAKQALENGDLEAVREALRATRSERPDKPERPDMPERPDKPENRGGKQQPPRGGGRFRR